MSNDNIRVGSRKSKLALLQAEIVANELKKHGHKSIVVPIRTEGDINLQQPIYSMGIQGVFTKALDTALLNKNIDIAVHSLKDVPTTLPSGIVINSVIKRSNPFDALISNTKANTKSTIGTGSLRSKAQWMIRFPEDNIKNIRGNIHLRIEKLLSSTWKGIILAKAAIERLKLKLEFETLDWMIPAPSQGIIGIACLETDLNLRKTLSLINCKQTHFCSIIEREFLKTLQGGCTAPIGAYSKVEGNKVLFKAGLFSLDGKKSLIKEKSFFIDDDPKFIGRSVAIDILNDGGERIIDEIKKNFS